MQEADRALYQLYRRATRSRELKEMLEEYHGIDSDSFTLSDLDLALFGTKPSKIGSEQLADIDDLEEILISVDSIAGWVWEHGELNPDFLSEGKYFGDENLMAFVEKRGAVVYPQPLGRRKEIEPRKLGVVYRPKDIELTFVANFGYADMYVVDIFSTGQESRELPVIYTSAVQYTDEMSDIEATITKGVLQGFQSLHMQTG